MTKRDDGDGRDGILDSGPGASNIDTIVTTVTKSLSGVQGCCPQTEGKAPTAIGGFPPRRAQRHF